MRIGPTMPTINSSCSPIDQADVPTEELQTVRAEIEPAAWFPVTPLTTASRSDPNGWYQQAVAVDTAGFTRNVLRLAIANLSPSERAETQILTCHHLARVDSNDDAIRRASDQPLWSALMWSAMVKAGPRVVTHAGIVYRVIQVGDVRVPDCRIGGVQTLHEWRGRGYARAVLTNAAAFAAIWLWAPFAVVLCSREDAAFYEHFRWQVVNAPIWSDQPGRRVRLAGLMAVILPCQGAAEWPAGTI